MKTLLKISCIILFLPGIGWADTLYLKSGRKLQGKVVGQSRRSIKFKTATGIQTITKKQIKRVTFDSNYGKSRADLERERKEKEAQKRAEAERKKREAAKKAEEERRKREEEARKAEQQRKKQEAARKTGKSSPSLIGALWRSALLPGWGQYYQGRTTAGLIYGAAFGGILALDAAAFGAAKSAEADYLATSDEYSLLGPLVAASALGGGLNLYYTSELSNQRSVLEQKKSDYNTLFFVTAGFYIWNLADVVLFAPNRTSSFHWHGRADGAALSFQYRF